MSKCHTFTATPIAIAGKDFARIEGMVPAEIARTMRFLLDQWLAGVYRLQSEMKDAAND